MILSKKKKYSKTELFESVPVPRALATMAVPTIISQLINLIYNMVDAFFIGRTGNSYMMAATTLSLTIVLMNIAFGNLFGVGGGSLIARLIGRGESGKARCVSAFSFYFAIFTALLYSTLIGLFLEPILKLFGASEFTLGYAKEYTFVVVVLGTLPSLLSMVMSHLLRNVGYASNASMGLSLGGIINIILDPIFMFMILPAGNEVLGAAIATLLSNIISCVYLILSFIKVSGSAPVSLRFSDMRKIDGVTVGELFSVGVPSAILTGLFDIANIFLNILASAHSDLVLAGMGIVMKIERVPNAIGIGICQGMLPIVAYNYASGNRERMKNTINAARVAGIAISILSIIMFELFASPITSFFLRATGESAVDTAKTLMYAIVFLQIRCLASPLQFLNYHSSYCMQAMGDGFGTMLHAVVRELVFYIPFMYILDGLFSHTGLAAALVAGEGCGAIFALILLFSYIRNKDKKFDAYLTKMSK